MILHFSEEPTIGKEYTFYQPLEPDFIPFDATLLKIYRMKKKKKADRDRFWGVFEIKGEDRKTEIDWYGWYDGGYEG